MDLIKALNRTADFIESVCYDAHIPVRIGPDGIVVLADQCRFYAVPVSSQGELRELQTRIYGYPPAGSYTYESAFANVKKLRGGLKPALKGNLKLPAYADFGVQVGNGAILFDFKLSDLAGEEYFEQLSLLELGDSRPNKIVLGKTLEGDVVILENEAPQHHHILLAGSSGSGKTTLGNTIIFGLATAYAPNKLKMFIMSGKQADIIPWQGLPHLLYTPVADPQKATSVLMWLEEERLRRSQLPTAGKKSLPRIFVYIGEINDLINGADATFANLMDTLMRLSRSELISFCVTTQRPRGDRVGGVDAKGQFSITLCGAMQNAQDAYLALGVGSGGAQFLPGRGAFVTSNGTRFQVGFVGDEMDTVNIDLAVTALCDKYGEAHMVSLPDVDIVSDTPRAQVDVLQTLKKLATETETGLNELSIVMLQNKMRWGYQRAARAFSKLQELEVLGRKRNQARRCPIDVSILHQQLGGGTNG